MANFNVRNLSFDHIWKPEIWSKFDLQFCTYLVFEKEMFRFGSLYNEELNFFSYISCCKITLPSFCICTFANSVQVLPSKRDTMPDVNWEYESSTSVSPEQPPRLFWEIEIMWWEWRVESPPPLFTVWKFWEFSFQILREIKFL